MTAPAIIDALLAGYGWAVLIATAGVLVIAAVRAAGRGM
jgi:hypothetical protein